MVPLPIWVIIDGQYIDMAIPVKNAAMSGLMPLLETVEYTEARFLPGSTSIGQIDCPSFSVLAASPYPMPASFNALRNVVSTGWADAGAARQNASAGPARVMAIVRFVLITGETLIDNSHIDNTLV